MQCPIGFPNMRGNIMKFPNGCPSSGKKNQKHDCEVPSRALQCASIMMCHLRRPSIGKCMIQCPKGFAYVLANMNCPNGCPSFEGHEVNRTRWNRPLWICRSKKSPTVNYTKQVPSKVLLCTRKHHDVPSRVPFYWKIHDSVPYRAPLRAGKHELH